jgi:hypothetical protein
MVLVEGLLPCLLIVSLMVQVHVSSQPQSKRKGGLTAKSAHTN